MIDVFYVPVDQLDSEWKNAAPLIRLAQKRVDHKLSMSDLHKEILDGMHQLWVVKKDGITVGSFTTSLITHPKMQSLRVTYLGGFGIEQWHSQAINAIKDLAKKLKCKTIEAEGRLGWSQFAKDYGFKELNRVYEMEI
jgi:hypothetical protein